MPHGFMNATLPNMGVTIPGPLITQGQAFYVNPYYGSGSGKKPNTALTSLSVALSKMTTNKNDVAYMLAAHDTAAYTTDYQSATLDWNKNLCHIMGVGCANMFSQRSRIALLSTYDTASNLFTVSGHDNQFHNLQFFEGVAGTNPTGCVKVSGNRNYFRRCHLAGIGNDANDIANAYSLYLSGAENVFEECVIGLDTIARGSAANADLYIAAGGLRNIFKNCLFIARVEHNTNSPHVRIAGGAMGNAGLIAMFENCKFLSVGVNYGYVNTYAIVHTAAPTAGFTVVDGRCETNAGNWGASGNHLYISGSATLAGYNTHLLYNS